MSSVALVSGVLATCNRIAVRALIAGASHGRAANTATIEDEFIHDSTQQKRTLSTISSVNSTSEQHRIAANRSNIQPPRKLLNTNLPLSAYSVEPCSRKYASTSFADEVLRSDDTALDSQPTDNRKTPLVRKSSISAQSGCAKDMMFGPSTALVQNRYGDDACFVQKHEIADVFGVADGVGGWRVYGLDPGSFSRALMSNCAKVVASGNFEPHRPENILSAAYEMVRTDNSPKKTNLLGRNRKKALLNEDIACGSSTACVVVLDKYNSQVHTANLGDSGYLLIRDGKVIHRSREQCHYFNAPYQIAHIPVASATNYFSDSVESAETAVFNVEPGDCLLMATDGLFDNVPSEFIECEIDAHNVMQVTDATKLQAICNALVLAARRFSMDEKHDSPFAQKARDEGIRNAIGGKPDDITVLLILVLDEKQS